MNLVSVFVVVCFSGGFLISNNGRSQVSGESSSPINGRSSRFAFPLFPFHGVLFGQELRLESRDETPIDVTASFPRHPNVAPSTVTVQPNGSAHLVLPSPFISASVTEYKHGIELSSNGSLAVYAVMNTTNGTRENVSVRLIPTRYLGTEYQATPPTGSESSLRSLELTLVAVEDKTNVVITHNGEAAAALALNRSQTFSLNRVVDSEGRFRVQSDKPVAVFIVEGPVEGGALRPATNETFANYFAIMQLLPEDHWSTGYLLRSNTCDHLQIIVGITAAAAAASNSTEVQIRDRTGSRSLKIPANRRSPTLAFLTVDDTTTTVVEADDKIQLLIYDSRRDSPEVDRHGYVHLDIHEAAMLLTEPGAVGSVLISACSTKDSCAVGDGESDKVCGVDIQRKAFNLNEGQTRRPETSNNRDVKHRYSNTFSRLSSAAGFYRTDFRTPGSSNLSPDYRGDGSETFASSASIDEYQTASAARPNLTLVYQRNAATDSFPNVSSSYQRSKVNNTSYTSSPTDRTWLDDLIRRTELDVATKSGTESHRNGGENEIPRSIDHSRSTSYPNVNAKTFAIFRTAINQEDRTVDSSSQHDEEIIAYGRKVTSRTSTEIGHAEETRVTPSIRDTLAPSGITEAGKGKVQTPLRFIYLPYRERNIISPAVAASVAEAGDGVRQFSTRVPATATYRTTKAKGRDRQKVLHRTISMFVMKQDAIDKAGHKMVNYFEIDAAEVEASASRHISPTVIAVITSLCGAVFFVIVCILGFVITEVFCTKGKIQRAKISPFIEISSTGY